MLQEQILDDECMTEVEGIGPKGTIYDLPSSQIHPLNTGRLPFSFRTKGLVIYCAKRGFEPSHSSPRSPHAYWQHEKPPVHRPLKPCAQKGKCTYENTSRQVQKLCKFCGTQKSGAGQGRREKERRRELERGKVHA